MNETKHNGGYIVAKSESFVNNESFVDNGADESRILRPIQEEINQAER